MHKTYYFSRGVCRETHRLSSALAQPVLWWTLPSLSPEKDKSDPYLTQRRYARVVRRRGGRPPARPPPHRLGTQPTCVGGVSCAGGAGRRAPPLSTPSEGRCRRPLCAAASRVPAPAASHDSATRLSARGGATPRPPPLGPPLACADAPDLAVNPTGAPPPAVGPGPPPTSVCPSGVRVGGPPGRGAPPGRPLAPAGRAASGGGWAHPRRIVYLRIMTQRGPSSPVGHRDRASIGGFDPIEPVRRHPLSMGLGPSSEKRRMVWICVRRLPWRPAARRRRGGGVYTSRRYDAGETNQADNQADKSCE